MLTRSDSDISKEEKLRAQISDEQCKRLQVLHEATLDDLMHARNHAFWEILEERNTLLREQ